MEILYNASKMCLRYVVPFKFCGSFTEAVKKVEEQYDEGNGQKKIWERKKNASAKSESDLYDYIRNEYCFPDELNEQSEQKNGCEWVYWKSEEAESKNGQSIKKLIYFADKIKKTDYELPSSWNIDIINLGLILFRNNMGFIWYEIKILEKSVTSNKLKRFQNVIRELNRGESSYLWEKQVLADCPDFGLLLDDRQNKEQMSNRMYKKYIIPFSIGRWINDIVNFINVEYFARRKSAYTSMVQKSLQNTNSLLYKQIYPKMCVEDEISAEGDKFLPDKAILFTYISFEDINEVTDALDLKYSLVYHLTNGYKDSYHFSNELISEIKRPFNNAFWYATQEGASYIAWTTADNKEVFNSLILSKVKMDYFTLYLKVLFQSFSLLVYAERIQQEISAVSSQYIIGRIDNSLTRLYSEINLFLTKNMATSVSYVHHQSEFYTYIKNQLRVREDIESVTDGLAALDSLRREQLQYKENKQAQEAWQNEQRREREAEKERRKQEEREKRSDEKMQAIMGLFALLTVSSALVDCFDFVSKFDNAEGDFWTLLPVTQRWEIVFFIIIGVISVVAIFVSIKSLIDAFRHKRK